MVDLIDPKSISYVLGGLKPLSVKFIKTLFIEKKGFKNIEKKSKLNLKFVALALIPG